jgi:hypothetical protein
VRTTVSSLASPRPLSLSMLIANIWERTEPVRKVAMGKLRWAKESNGPF